ncbi:MAG: hypothetical protein EPO51_04775 [Phenylobacterium sp.]|uniref:hypothetical protein n=1 Tax=Phenylobacterium sp. TaxID=1871053 RepID=UPI001204ED70|nr:hypothetical protein [Phenylobacterium sp.]TAJ73609.1 MAG: hypothetical protein EPO51_04775 [Phenylobacterium sp.]
MTATPPNPEFDLARLDAASRAAVGLWTQAWGGLDSYALARESMDAWACAWTAWTDYLGRLATSAGPLALMDAGTRLMTDNLEICSRAAATRLAAGGVATPLLNDA